jgi:hypothetical protein
VAPHIQQESLLAKPSVRAIDDMLKEVFPHGVELLDDDVAVILLNLARTEVAENGYRERTANTG